MIIQLIARLVLNPFNFFQISRVLKCATIRLFIECNLPTFLCHAKRIFSFCHTQLPKTQYNNGINIIDKSSRESFDCQWKRSGGIMCVMSCHLVHNDILLCMRWLSTSLLCVGGDGLKSLIQSTFQMFQFLLDFPIITSAQTCLACRTSNWSWSHSYLEFSPKLILTRFRRRHQHKSIKLYSE